MNTRLSTGNDKDGFGEKTSCFFIISSSSSVFGFAFSFSCTNQTHTHAVRTKIGYARHRCQDFILEEEEEEKRMIEIPFFLFVSRGGFLNVCVCVCGYISIS